MAIFPLPPGLIARLNVPPTYKTAIEDTAPPAYIPPLNRISTCRPESIPLPPSPTPSISIPTQQTPPPEYSPSVYSQQQRLSHYLPDSNPDPAALGFPSSPRRPSASKAEHPSHFKESQNDLSMRVDLEADRDDAESEEGTNSVSRLYSPVKEVGVKRQYWKKVVVALGISLVVVIVVVVAVCVSLDGKRS